MCRTYRILNTMPALEVVVVNAFGVAASIGLRRDRRWARRAIVATYAILGTLSFWWPAIGNAVEWSWPDRFDATTLLAVLLPPVVCLAIHGAVRHWPRRSFFLDPGT